MTIARRLATTACIAALAVSGLAAKDGGSAPTLEAKGSIKGGVATVQGSARAGAPGPGSVEGIVTDFAQADVSTQAGTQLTDALVEATDDGLTFTWQLANLSAAAPPEVVRYTWSFAIGEETFQLQAKTTNIASITLADDPAGHVTHAGASFQVRGNCVAQYQGTPVANCPHIGWTEGAFDTANDQVTMTVPWGFHELIEPGAVVVENQTAGMSIAASFQAVANTSNLSSFINEWTRPYVAGLGVFVATAPADTDPARVKGGKPLAVAKDGSFKGTVEVEPGDAVFVRACTGFTCTVKRVA